MRRVVAVAMCAAVVACGQAAWAQEDATPVQQITLDELEVVGSAQAAQVTRMRAADRARFERLGSLKRSVIGRVVESGQDQALVR